MGDGFYRSEDPTNSIKVLKEHIVHRQINRKKYNKDIINTTRSQAVARIADRTASQQTLVPN